MQSIWSNTATTPDFPQLQGDKTTDVLIIGGGMAGLLCAHSLHQAGVPYLLVESNKIGSGVTKNTTAKITAQHGLIYHDLLQKAGAQKAKLYLNANQHAVRQYKRLCADIDCNFEEKDAFVYSLNNREIIEQELSALQKIGFPATFEPKLPLPFPVAGAVRFPRQAQFHPLKFIAQLSKNLHIYEHTPVKTLAPYTAVTDHGKIKAKHIIVATHFPFLNKHGAYFLKLYQHRSYAIALEHAPNLSGMYVDEKQNGLSFRNFGGLLIIGGGDHRTGQQGGNWKQLRNFATNAYPGVREKYAWATQDCMSLDNIPYIGRYGKSARGLYVATGFNKWGMTGSMVAANLLTDLILERKNPCASVFSPGRSILKPQLLVNGLTAVGNLLTPSPKRCPHMGCALKWNKAEQSWDCPCHGSRFDKSGALLIGPATGSLENQK